IQLAAVCDGKTGKMSLYLNGQPIASKTAKQKRVLTLGTLELGNWTPNAKKADANYRIREFHGRMDEFVLLRRPLSAEEIRRQYHLGKPRESGVVAQLPPPASSPKP